jgi:hypothetical protein
MDFSWRTQVVALALTFVGGLATVLGTPRHQTQHDRALTRSTTRTHARFQAARWPCWPASPTR